MRAVAVAFVALSVLVSGAVVRAPARAQESATGMPEAYLELLRSDLRVSKEEVLNGLLDLTADESEKFWPLYRSYADELAKLGDRRYELIKQFSDNYGAITEEQARDIANTYFDIQHDTLQLKRRYFRRVANAVSARTAARFIQVENVVATMIDLQLAAEMPLFE